MPITEQHTIERVVLYEIAIPLEIPFTISGGTLVTRKSLIVELHSEGVVGYGESAPFEAAFYSSETIDSAAALLRRWLLPRVAGKTIESIAALNDLLNADVRGNYFAKAGVENAYWDLVARKNNLSLHALVRRKLEELGVAEKFRQSEPSFESGVAIGIPPDGDVHTLQRWTEMYLQEGYRRVKIKIKPGWDVAPVRAVREVIGEDFPFWVDANAAYRLEEHRDVFKDLDRFHLCFYEQPLHHDDLLDHAKLARAVQTPLCLDESLKSPRVAQQAVELQSAAVWNIKIQRVGGLLNALKIYRIGVEHGIALWGGTMPESGVGSAPMMALASFVGFVYPADIEPSARWYGKGKDLIEIEMSPDGRIAVPTGVGLGLPLHEENYRQIRTLVFDSADR
ncbi:MAG: o-succinylbenzoate synthase [Abditibacteriales bacterium]|nr:o-succinylbenzoate synthase [Abditibacteriales bacterium]MDW8366211.1 o-succinylbenzoate synthase [Abditibacteriales bacterium]